MYYYFPDPPFVLLAFGLFIGLTSGLAFEAVLKEKVQEWKTKRSIEIFTQMQGLSLRLPFLGICLGVCVFLASGLEVFGLFSWLAYTISLLMTILIGALVWEQLGKVLVLLRQGGSKALDLDSY
jgi:hypothetical protein